MTVPNTNITTGPYVGNGLVDTYDYDFGIESSSEIRVFETDTVGVEYELALTTDFTVTGVGVDAGGTVTRVAGVLPVGYTWYIRSNIPQTQATDFQSQGGFFPDVHENAFDKLTRLIQQLEDNHERSLTISDSYPGTLSRLPNPEALKFLRWKDDLSGMENVNFITTVTMIEADVVEKVSNMLGLVSITSPDPGKVYIMAGFYFTAPETKPVGSGMFIWQSGLSRSLANGGTIVDPGNIGGFDGTVSTRDAFLTAQGTGVGSGCWVKIDQDVIDVTCFGAVGDWDGATGTFDDAAFIAAEACASTIGNIQIIIPNSEGRYYIKDGFEVSGDNVDVVSTGGEIQYGPSTTTANHCIRVTGKSNSIRDLNIYCLASLVRDDTGFAISINGSDSTVVDNCGFFNIASAAVWCTDATDFTISNCVVDSTDADGLHVSNGCSGFTISGNIVAGCEDDSIAIVGDVPANPQPRNGTISGNVVRDGVAGHGLLYINASDLTFSGNTISSVGYAGLGNYTWVSATYSTNITVTGNNFINCGTNPSSQENACCALIQGTQGGVISGNVFDGVAAGAYSEALMQLDRFKDLVIKDNVFKNITGDGIVLLPGIGSAVADLTGLNIDNNTFLNISEYPIYFDVVEVNELFITGNSFHECAYDAGAVAHIYVDDAGAQPLRIMNNTVLTNQAKGIFYDTTNCTDVQLMGNIPEKMVSYVPNVASSAGAITSYTINSANFMRKGSMIFVDVRVTIDDNGTGSGSLYISLPFTGLSQGVFSGRDDGVSGDMLQGKVGTVNVSLTDYKNAYPAVTGSVIDVSGWFTI